MNNERKNIDKLIREWALYGSRPFRGQERTEEVEKAIALVLKSAFKVGKKTNEGLGGQEFGLVWDEENQISVHLGDIPEGALTLKV